MELNEDSTLEVDQLGNQDWPWSPGESLKRKVALFMKVISCIAKGKREVQLSKGKEENIRKQGKPT
jgi:hypothetical protein